MAAGEFASARMRLGAPPRAFSLSAKASPVAALASRGSHEGEAENGVIAFLRVAAAVAWAWRRGKEDMPIQLSSGCRRRRTDWSIALAAARAASRTLPARTAGHVREQGHLRCPQAEARSAQAREGSCQPARSAARLRGEAVLWMDSGEFRGCCVLNAAIEFPDRGHPLRVFVAFSSRRSAASCRRTSRSWCARPAAPTRKRLACSSPCSTTAPSCGAC